MTRLSKLGCALLAVVLVLGVTFGAFASDWPSKPITMVIGWSAGGGSDVTARLVFPYVEKILGQKIIIVNKPGAGGEISFSELARSKPDGYYFAWTNTPNSVAFPIARETTYQIEDFAPCANIIYDPGVIVVQTESPFETIQDMIDYAKENPGYLTIGNSGTGGDDYIAVANFSREAKIEVSQVPFEGAAPNIAALLGGHVMAAAINASEVKPHVEAGNMRVLAVMDDERNHLIPEVPTFLELGYNILSGSARGFSAPAGTPQEILDKMAAAVAEALQDPEFLEKAEKAYQLIKFMGPEEYKEYLYSVRDQVQAIYDENPW